MSEIFSNDTEFYITLHALSMLDGAVHVYLRHFSILLNWPGPVCYPGQANRFWAHADWLSSLWKVAQCRGCIWGTGKEKEHC